MGERGRRDFSRRRAEARKREKQKQKDNRQFKSQVLDAGGTAELEKSPAPRSGKPIDKEARLEQSGNGSQVLDAGLWAL